MNPTGTAPTVALYYLTRDTNCDGELSSEVDVWYRKPLRHKLGLDKGYVWLPSDYCSENVSNDLGFYGSFSMDYIAKTFRTRPDTDMECIRCLQGIAVKPNV